MPSCATLGVVILDPLKAFLEWSFLDWFSFSSPVEWLSSNRKKDEEEAGQM
jgi:hypothetical protein